MAYQNVGTPRFYINDFAFGGATGITTINGLIDGNPSTSSDTSNSLELADLGAIGVPDFIDIAEYNTPNYNKPNYIATLGDNLAGNGTNRLPMGLRVSYKSDGNQIRVAPPTPLVNAEPGLSGNEADFFYPIYNGFSIVELGGSSFDDTYKGVKIVIGSNNVSTSATISTLFYGRFFDISQSANLSLTLGREFGGTKEITTYNGSSISNTMWTGSPRWLGGRAAWELGSAQYDAWVEEGTLPYLPKSGRRTWDLSFSFLNDSDVFGPNQLLSTYIETDTGYGDDIGAHNFSPIPFTNGTFDDNYDGWEPFPGSSSELTHATDKLQISMPAGFGGVHQTEEDAIIGKTYQVSADIWQGTTANTDIVMTFGGKNEILVISDTQQKFTMEITPETLTTGFNIHSTSGDGGTIFLDNVEVKINNYDNFNDNILSDDNFFSQVWHKTLGGNLTFIFQPDNTNFNPDQFALCKIADKSMKVTQTAFNVYDISLKIEEVW